MHAFHPVAEAAAILSATTTSSRVALGGMPRTGAFQIRVKNAAGGAEAQIRFGDVTVVATTGNLSIPAGGVEVFTVRNLDTTPVTYVAAITATGTATLTFTTGYGV